MAMPTQEHYILRSLADYGPTTDEVLRPTAESESKFTYQIYYRVIAKLDKDGLVRLNLTDFTRHITPAGLRHLKRNEKK